MNTPAYSYQYNYHVAQAYGSSSYGTSTYTCQSGQACRDTMNSGGTSGGSSAAAPNTGFLGLSQDAVLPVMSGAVLVAVAVVGIVFVITSRLRARRRAGRN